MLVLVRVFRSPPLLYFLALLLFLYCIFICLPFFNLFIPLSKMHESLFIIFSWQRYETFWGSISGALPLRTNEDWLHVRTWLGHVTGCFPTVWLCLICYPQTLASFFYEPQIKNKNLPRVIWFKKKNLKYSNNISVRTIFFAELKSRSE